MPPRRPRRELHLAQLLPNLMTIGALCAGLTAIKSGIDGRETPHTENELLVLWSVVGVVASGILATGLLFNVVI